MAEDAEKKKQLLKGKGYIFFFLAAILHIYYVYVLYLRAIGDEALNVNVFAIAYFLLGMIAPFFLEKEDEEGGLVLLLMRAIPAAIIGVLVITITLALQKYGFFSLGYFLASNVLLFIFCLILWNFFMGRVDLTEAKTGMKYMLISLSAFFIPFFAEAIIVFLTDWIPPTFLEILIFFIKFIATFFPVWIMYLAVSQEVPFEIRRYSSLYLAMLLLFLVAAPFTSPQFRDVIDVSFDDLKELSAQSTYNPIEPVLYVWDSTRSFFIAGWDQLSVMTGLARPEKEPGSKSSGEEGGEEGPSIGTGIPLLDKAFGKQYIRATQPWQGKEAAEKPQSGIDLSRLSLAGGTLYEGGPVVLFADMKADALSVPVEVVFSCFMRGKQETGTGAVSIGEEPIQILATEIIPSPYLVIGGAEESYEGSIDCNFGPSPELSAGTYDSVLEADFNAESFAKIKIGFVEESFYRTQKATLHLQCPQLKGSIPETTQGTPVQIGLSFPRTPERFSTTGGVYTLSASLKNTAGGKLKSLDEFFVLVPKEFRVSSITGDTKIEKKDCGAVNKGAVDKESAVCDDKVFDVYAKGLEGGGKSLRDERIVLRLDGPLENTCDSKTFLVVARYHYELTRKAANIKLEKIE